LIAWQEMALRTLGNDGLFLFTSLDTNMDMQISPEEFRPIVDKIIAGPPPSEYEGTQEADPQGEGLTMLARFEPLLMETMSKSRDGFLGVGQSCLAGLRGWKKAEAPSQHFGANQFKVFLPPKSDLELGEAWWLVPNDLNLFTGYLPNSRYYPPPPVAKEIIIFKLLSMFHPRPFVKSRFAPQGSVACIRAQSDMYYDIVFRVHAEFQLNEPPAFPFWFTPAQFTGHVTIARDSSHVRAFHMFVPNNRSLNVDMEWLFGSMDQGNMEVDIGFMPKMELVAEGPSVPALIYDENGNAINTSDPDVEPIQFVFENIEWRSEISFQEAYRQMEVAMYPFKKIQYHPFTDAFEKAKAEDKLVHSILLWGALDDQSCAGSGADRRVLTASYFSIKMSENFISSWSLVKDLEDLKKQEEQAEHAKWATLHLAKYTFPVEMMIALPNGTVVHCINANDFLDATAVKAEDLTPDLPAEFLDPTSTTYLKFLKEGLQKAQTYLQA
uniref:Selenoprotein N n=1 Tax=Petromyzon marinus TaxID=7757 RepID=S4RML1_PETMA